MLIRITLVRLLRTYPTFVIGMSKRIIVVLSIGLLAWAYKAIQPPPPKICGTRGGPPVTAPRIKLRDGRHLAYKEYGLSKETARHKIIFIHGFTSTRHDALSVTDIPSEVVEELGVYFVSFDRPGYGESDPDPKRTPKSLALDVEELADHLGLGYKFYVIGISLGGQAVWGCLRYIPQRLKGATLIAPVINYWWPGLPTKLANEAYYRQLLQDQWALRAAHYAPWLTYWWNTQKLFPALSIINGRKEVISRQDLELLPKVSRGKQKSLVTQQGEHESLHRDMMVGFGRWEFDPTDIENPFPNNQSSVHLWQGDEDRLVPVRLQRYIVSRLRWIHYHEVPGSGHFLPYAPGMSETIVKTLLLGTRTD